MKNVWINNTLQR